MAKNDPVVSFLSALVDGAMAPVQAGIELATDGRISTDTGTRVITGAVTGSVTDGVADSLKKG